MTDVPHESDRPGKASFTAGSWATVVVAMCLLALAAAFVWLQLTSPSDGARLEPGESVWRPNGVVVTALGEQPGGLREGDLVVAAAGRRMEEWAQAFFEPGAPRPRWQVGQSVSYTVLRDGRPVELEVTLSRYHLSAVLTRNWSTILFAFVSQIVATFVFLRRPREPAARVLLLWAAALMSATTWSLGLQVDDLVGGVGFWLYMATSGGAYLLFWLAALHFALVFPQPHALLLRYPRLLWIWYTLPYGLYLGYLVALRHRAASTLTWIGQWIPAISPFAVVSLVLVIALVIHGYHSSYDRTTRRQARLVVYASMVSGGGGLLLWILPPLVLGYSLIPASALGLLLVPFPVALAIAILRHQLFDIDVVISRTLLYGTLTAVLALVYLSSVVLLQSLFRTLTGQTSNLAIIASTLTIAALFNPLRRRIQAFIDRRFYRRKYDAEQVLAAFGQVVRDEVDLDTLTGELVRVIEETMQPAHISLWLRSDTPLPSQDREVAEP
ncbi:MAG: hypothetical protein M3220_15310 [Chloroflexota bacterium]|nr:hypothetical protein [Chloroflexota bacterium]